MASNTTLTKNLGGHTGSNFVDLNTAQTLTNKSLTSPIITGTGALAGAFTGALAGNVTGNVDGDLTGDSTGAHNGTVGATTPATIVGTTIGGTVITASTNFAGDVTGDVTGTVSDISNHKTDDLDEGSTNQYYTNTRARGSVSVTDAGGDGSLAYNNTSGVITYTGPSAANVRAHLSGGTGVTISSGAIAIGQGVGTTDNVTFNNVTVDGTLNTDDITAATVTASGNVIITGNLTVNGTQTTVSSNTVNVGDNIMVLNSDETGSPSQNGGIEIERGTTANVSFLWDETNDRWTTGTEQLGLGSIYFGTNASNDDIFLKQIGGSGTDQDSLHFQGLVNGGLELDGDLTILKSSDERLKDNVKAIEDPLEKIKMIGGYNYTWNELGEAHTMHKEGQRDIGVIAQEVEKIIPEAVTDKSNGYKAVQYDKIIPLLIECVKDQQTMIEKLQSELDLLKSFIPY